MNVVITGASKGIGKAVAEEFCAAGANLFLCSRNITGLEDWKNDLQKKHNIEIYLQNTNLSVETEVKSLGHVIADRFSAGVDVLVNNAGVFLPGGIYNEPEGSLEKTLKINLFSAYHLTRQILPGMIRKKSGHIFNICSTASLKAYPNGGAYSISKWALLGFSRNLREEMKAFGIKVTAVIPGPTYTDSWKESGLPEDRFMESRDIAKMIITSSQLSTQACVEDILMRPLSGDIDSAD